MKIQSQTKLFRKSNKIAKIFIFLLLLTCGGLIVQTNLQKQHDYLKEQTMLRHVKGKPFLSKAPADWMLEQIESDFEGIHLISLREVDETFQVLKSLSPMVARYRIIDNELYRYFVPEEKISLSDNQTEKAIKTILQRTNLPNMDFLLSYFDNYPFGYQVNSPILVSAKLKNASNGILIPDWRSIGHWWMSDIKSIKKAQTPWEKKRPFALWRGGFTKNIRHTLCQLSLKHPHLLDARLNSVPVDHELWKHFQEEGILGGRVSWEDFLSCKYLPYVDGVMCAAPALQWRLLSGSLTFKPDSEEIQWFYRALKPQVHYVPVKNDLSDLIEKIEWAKSHDDECRKIAEHARDFAQENLLYYDVLNYFALVLKRYGNSQNIDSKTIKEQIMHDHRWIKIQDRKAIQKMMKNNEALYCKESTPLNL